MHRFAVLEAGDWTNDPNRISLRLLPSGPDRIGEWPVRRQPPTKNIGYGPRQDKEIPGTG